MTKTRVLIIDDASPDNTAEVVNMSFGGNEFTDRTFLAALKQGNAEGITFVASSGDSGSNGGIVSWPAVEPRVLALGGTDISYSGGKYVHNQAWSSSGGGVSRVGQRSPGRKESVCASDGSLCRLPGKH